MDLDLTSKEVLTPFELAFLVNGVIALVAHDRYASVIIRAHRQVCSQIKLILRWNKIVDLIEVPSP